MIKKIEDLDYYDLLNLSLDASAQEIENAYLLAVATYHEASLASYSALSPDERHFILGRIEDAFQTLVDPEKRKAYNALILPSRPEFKQRAYFRKSTARLEIEDASPEEKLWGKVRALFNPRGRKNNKGNHRGMREGDDALARLEKRLYYGEYLKRVRETRGISLEEMAGQCALSVDEIKALEEENRSAFRRGKDFDSRLKLYAHCLGLDSENGRKSPSARNLRKT